MKDEKTEKTLSIAMLGGVAILSIKIKYLWRDENRRDVSMLDHAIQIV